MESIYVYRSVKKNEVIRQCVSQYIQKEAHNILGEFHSRLRLVVIVEYHLQCYHFYSYTYQLHLLYWQKVYTFP